MFNIFFKIVITMAEQETVIPWVFYIIENSGYTYAGVSPHYERRLRQHNGEIKGGAKYTISKGPGWKHLCIVCGFRNKIEALQFEWAVKHAHPRNTGGVKYRIKKLYDTFRKERWTANSPLSQDISLELHWKLTINLNDIDCGVLPSNVISFTASTAL